MSDDRVGDKPVINEDWQLSDIVVINPGIGYSTNANVYVDPKGKNALLNASIRKLSIDNYQWQNENHLEKLLSLIIQTFKDIHCSVFIKTLRFLYMLFLF